MLEDVNRMKMIMLKYMLHKNLADCQETWSIFKTCQSRYGAIFVKVIRTFQLRNRSDCGCRAQLYKAIAQPSTIRTISL